MQARNPKPKALIEEINEQTYPNNQLGLDDETSDSMGESTEEELIRVMAARQRAKERAQKKGRPGMVRYDDSSSSEEVSEEDEEPGERPSNANIKKKMWHVVIHNKTREQVLQMINNALPRMTRCIACEDEGEQTHTTHYHIGMVLKTSTTMGGIKGLFGEDAHVKWCKNLANLFNYIRGDGTHSDFKEVIFKLNDYVTKKIGTGLRQRFFEEWWKTPTMDHFYEMVAQREWMTCCDQRKHIEAVVDNLNKWKHIREKERVIVWISGSTGSGKSYLAHKLMDKFQNVTKSLATTATISTSCGQLVGLSRNEKMVVFDDIKLEKIVLQDLLQVTDQYILTLDVKGSQAHYDPDLVIITCLNAVDDLGNLRPNWEQKEILQLQRRFTHRIYIEKDNQNYVSYKIVDKTGEKNINDMNEVMDTILNALNPVPPQ